MGKNPLQLATLYAKKDLSIVILPARFEEPSPMNPLPHHPVAHGVVPSTVLTKLQISTPVSSELYKTMNIFSTPLLQRI